MVGFHDGVTYCRDALEEVLGEWGVGAWERLDEDDASVRLFVAGVQTGDADGHCRWCTRW